MYPQVDSWLQTKAMYDPQGVFTSNLGRRLGLSYGVSLRGPHRQSGENVE